MDDVGLKDDKLKLDWSLLDFDLIEPLIHVLVLGEQRYNFENWKKDFGPNDQRRFRAAMIRHIKAAGNDPLSINEADGGVYHYAQIAINALFALYHAKKKEKTCTPKPRHETMP